MIEAFLNRNRSASENSILKSVHEVLADSSDTTFDVPCKSIIVRVQKITRSILESLFKLVLCSGKGVWKGICSKKSNLQVPESLSNIINLAQLSIQEAIKETAKQFRFCFF
jgi:hypothetical protein